MGYGYLFLSIGVSGLNVKAAAAVAGAACGSDLYLQCSKLSRVTMPGFGNIYRPVLTGGLVVLEGLGGLTGFGERPGLKPILWGGWSGG